MGGWEKHCPEIMEQLCLQGGATDRRESMMHRLDVRVLCSNFFVSKRDFFFYMINAEVLNLAN